MLLRLELGRGNALAVDHPSPQTPTRFGEDVVDRCGRVPQERDEGVGRFGFGDGGHRGGGHGVHRHLLRRASFEATVQSRHAA